jgi:hypothetical protein
MISRHEVSSHQGCTLPLYPWNSCFPFENPVDDMSIICIECGFIMEPDDNMTLHWARVKHLQVCIACEPFSHVVFKCLPGRLVFYIAEAQGEHRI